MSYQILFTLILLFIFIKGKSITKNYISNIANKYKYDEKRTSLIRKVLLVNWTIIFIVLFILIWGISIKGITVYFTGFFALAGIALFASWSVLSNITSAIILFFEYPIKEGNNIRIQDGDNSVEGEVIGLSLFNIEIH
jgi:MscS family membrane protein